VGCFIGAIVGTPWFPIIGTILGACLGAFVGAASYEYISLERKPGEALWIGLGAALGKVAGMLAKMAVGLVMVAVLLLKLI